jgi:hypothetical protein
MSICNNRNNLRWTIILFYFFFLLFGDRRAGIWGGRIRIWGGIAVGGRRRSVRRTAPAGAPVWTVTATRWTIALIFLFLHFYSVCSRKQGKNIRWCNCILLRRRGWWCKVKHCGQHDTEEHLVTLHTQTKKRFIQGYFLLMMPILILILIVFFVWSITKCSPL